MFVDVFLSEAVLLPFMWQASRFGRPDNKIVEGVSKSPLDAPDETSSSFASSFSYHLSALLIHLAPLLSRLLFFTNARVPLAPQRPLRCFEPRAANLERAYHVVPYEELPNTTHLSFSGFRDERFEPERNPLTGGLCLASLERPECLFVLVVRGTSAVSSRTCPKLAVGREEGKERRKTRAKRRD